ncbi:segregation/condensation protein A [bacterium]|nr:segregation/condensation protein A [bacterium]
MSQAYKIKLQNFEGPLDLLLFFVRKDELNIYDIPISRITKSYLEYLQLMTDLNLDIASEFILMAATLMRIKAKSMLPPDPSEEEEEEMMDPREELSRRLIEYRQFKEASKTLSELDEYWRTVYRRTYFNFDLLPRNEEEAIGLKDISFFDLLTAYKKAMEKKPKPFFHRVERLNVTIEQQIQYIMDFFRDRNCYLFTELCEAMDKIEIVVTFLALLDLVKKGDIAIRQASIFDDIWIYKASEFKDDALPELASQEDADVAETDITTISPEVELSEQPISADVSHEEVLIEDESALPQNENTLTQIGVEQVIEAKSDIASSVIENEIQTEEILSQNTQTDTLAKEDLQEEFVSDDNVAPQTHDMSIEDDKMFKPVADQHEETQNEIQDSVVNVNDGTSDGALNHELIEEESAIEDLEEANDLEEEKRKKEEADELREEEELIMASYFPEGLTKQVADQPVIEDEQTVSDLTEEEVHKGVVESNIESVQPNEPKMVEEIDSQGVIESEDEIQTTDSSEQKSIDTVEFEAIEAKTATEVSKPKQVDDENIQKNSVIKNFFKKIVSFVKRIFSK